MSSIATDEAANKVGPTSYPWMVYRISGRLDGIHEEIYWKA